jgi:pimeloyl-ACP methyl ester carboxylesterase
MSTDTEIRPFQIDMPEEAIADLRRRVDATRWPGQELVEDRSQGVQLATLQALARYWATDYDWRRCEKKLNARRAVFPGEIFRAPRSWVERAYPTLTYFNEVDKGGHFAAWEQPELFATEIRAAFRSLRT